LSTSFAPEALTVGAATARRRVLLDEHERPLRVDARRGDVVLGERGARDLVEDEAVGHDHARAVGEARVVDEQSDEPDRERVVGERRLSREDARDFERASARNLHPLALDGDCAPTVSCSASSSESETAGFWTGIVASDMAQFSSTCTLTLSGRVASAPAAHVIFRHTPMFWPAGRSGSAMPFAFSGPAVRKRKHSFFSGPMVPRVVPPTPCFTVIGASRVRGRREDVPDLRPECDRRDGRRAVERHDLRDGDGGARVVEPRRR
jgi:hypothetical protein